MSGTPSSDDDDLFRRALRDVKPLQPDTVEPYRFRPAPLPRQTWRNDRAVLLEMAGADMPDGDVETGDDLLYRRPGLQHGVLRKLRRGQFAVQDQLDLHGLRTDEAKLAVAAFLKQAIASGFQCVRIVHGKGMGSHGKLPVLKPKLASWLIKRKDILAYCSARPMDGGTGAMYVLLRKSGSGQR